MPYCTYCGSRIDQGNRFCRNCGAPVSSSESRSEPSQGLTYDASKEKDEAYRAGQQALNSLRLAQQQLNQAKNWGIADILGGGLIISMVKRQKMNNAQQYITQAKADLERFRRELSDVRELNYIDIDTSDFMSFADWFFDGFVVDFMVQSQINTARRQVDEAVMRVERILSLLK